MPKNPKQREKILVLLDILRKETDENHPMSVPTMVERLGEKGIVTERKSVYDSIAAIQGLGYDIVLQRGRGYYMGEREFQLAELKLLADAVQASKFITPQKSAELIDKLSASASVYEARSLQRQVYVAGKAKSVNERIYYTIDAIYEAIAQNRQVSFRYFDYDRSRVKVFRKDGRSYQVSPFALIRDNDNYYLVAYEGKSAELRHYRVDKMDRLQVIREAERQGLEVFVKENPGRYADRHFGMFRGEEQEVVMRCTNRMAHVLIDRFGDDVAMIPEEGDTFRAVVRVVISPQFFGWLFGLEDSVTLLEPEHVRTQMREHLEKVLKNY